MTSKNTIQSVDRALDVLEILKNHPEGIGVTELSEILDVAKSTSFRILNSLLKKGFVSQNEQDSKYFLGLKLLELGEVVSKNLDIKKISNPYLYKIRELTDETAHLAVLEGLDVVYIDKIESYQTLRMFSNIGKRGPIYCTGLGKAMLAFLPESHINKILDEIKFNKFTEKTIITKEDLRSDLELIRTRGYAIDDEEHEEGIKCAAAPIFNYTGDVIAGISVASPTFRLDDDKFQKMVDSVLDSSEKISKEVGYKK